MMARPFRVAWLPLLAAPLSGAVTAEDAAPAPPPASEAPAPPRKTEALPPGPPAPAKPAPKESIAVRLKDVRVSLDFTDTPLVDVLMHVRDVSAIDFAIDARVVERLKKDPLKVTMKIRDIPLESALKLLLGGKRLSAVERAGRLVIVPQEDVEREIVVRVYDIRDLSALDPKDSPGPDLGLPPTPAKAVPPDAFRLEKPSPPPQKSVIVDLIRKQCGGASWESPNTSIVLNNGMLIVAQTRRVHAEIQRLLDLLRKSQ
jgi:hypothetical protein